MTDRPAVQRVRAALVRANHPAEIVTLSESAKTAADAALALGIEVGQVASSIVFRLPGDLPLLVITSGRHRVDTKLVAEFLGVSPIGRADAEFVKRWSGFVIGGVSPIAWVAETTGGVSPVAWVSESNSSNSEFGYPEELTILIDAALDEYQVLWAAAGHTHAVFPTTFAQLVAITGATPIVVGD